MYIYNVGVWYLQVLENSSDSYVEIDLQQVEAGDPRLAKVRV